MRTRRGRINNEPEVHTLWPYGDGVFSIRAITGCGQPFLHGVDTTTKEAITCELCQKFVLQKVRVLRRNHYLSPQTEYLATLCGVLIRCIPLKIRRTSTHTTGRITCPACRQLLTNNKE